MGALGPCERAERRTGGRRRARFVWRGNGADRRQPAVHAEDLLIDERGDGEAVEAVGEGLPDLDVVAALACRGALSQRRPHPRKPDVAAAHSS